MDPLGNLIIVGIIFDIKKFKKVEIFQRCFENVLIERNITFHFSKKSHITFFKIFS